MNLSITSGSVPMTFKHAAVQPLLKKSNLDPTLVNNYRPISKLPFLSKVLEKIILTQLLQHLQQNDILDTFQSGFRAKHSTESALLKVYNDLLLFADAGECSMLMLLDLSAAFDTVDHQILLHRLNHLVGIEGSALDWFASYLSDRKFSVHLGPFISTPASLSCGVPQGSILGPILFSIYMLPLGNIFKKHNIRYHCYADDSQLYLPLRPEESSLTRLTDCLAEIKDWMACNMLQLNENKSEIVIFGPPDSVNTITTNLGSLAPLVKPCAKDLGVFLDSSFKLDKQVNFVVKSCFFQLRTIAKIKPILCFKDLERVINSLIFSRLDYCNSLYSGINQSSLARLQLVQNAAARLLTGTRRRDHITPILASLHWLPVIFRINFKILLFVFKALSGVAPSYIRDLLTPHSTPRCLRSADQGLLSVPRSKLKHRGDRAFSVIGPKLWNSIPPHVRSAPSIEIFKIRLKTYFYDIAFQH